MITSSLQPFSPLLKQVVLNCHGSWVWLARCHCFSEDSRLLGPLGWTQFHHLKPSLREQSLLSAGRWRLRTADTRANTVRLSSKLAPSFLQWNILKRSDPGKFQMSNYFILIAWSYEPVWTSISLSWSVFRTCKFSTESNSLGASSRGPLSVLRVATRVQTPTKGCCFFFGPWATTSGQERRLWWQLASPLLSSLWIPRKPCYLWISRPPIPSWNR